MKKMRSVHQLLNGDSINRLLEHIRHLKMLELRLRACVDAETFNHLQIADHQNCRLIINADSTAWATRLRYLAPQLLQCLQQSLSPSTLQRIDIRVMPASQPPVRPVRHIGLSAASAELINDTANDVKAPALRTALKRLARRHRDKSSH